MLQPLARPVNENKHGTISGFISKDGVTDISVMILNAKYTINHTGVHILI